MTQEETVKRIEANIDDMYNRDLGGVFWEDAKNLVLSERNKVLDEAIEALGKCEDQEQRKGHSLSEYAFKDAIFILESLKVDL